MQPCDGRAVCHDEKAPPATPIEKVLRILSVVTMLMTIPQAVSVWTDGAAGTSVLTWGTYLLSAVV